MWSEWRPECRSLETDASEARWASRLRSVSEQFRMGMVYSKLTKDLEIVEVLLTASQRDDWLARNARRGSSGQS